MVEKFPVLLILASQRIEDIMGWDLPSDTTKRGSLPSVVEYCILAYVAGTLFNIHIIIMVSVLCGVVWSLVIQSNNCQFNSIFDVVIQERERAFLESQYHKLNCPSQAYYMDDIQCQCLTTKTTKTTTTTHNNFQ